MKVAIHLSGEPRDFDYIYDDLKSKLVNIECDIFAHTWLNFEDGISNLPIHHERGGFFYQSFLNVISSGKYLDRIQPKKFIAENFSNSDPFLKFSSLDNVPSSISRMNSMFYSIQKSFELSSTSDYDMYVRARPDLFLQNKIDMKEMCCIVKSNPSLVIFPDLYINVGNYPGEWLPNGDYVPDFMWFGGPLMAESMLNIYDEIDFFCEKHLDIDIHKLGSWPSVPEHYLMRFLKYKNFIIGKIKNKVMLARQHKQFIETGTVTF